ncbi:MAG TPA: hypothetical protein VIJ38_12045 [Acidobacteriaceae bacterium]
MNRGVLPKKEVGPGSTKFDNCKGETMGILEELAGAAAAVEGAKKLDPNAGIVTEGVAAFAGFEGTEAIVDHFEKKDDENKDA